LVFRAEPVLGIRAGLDVDEPGLHHAAPVARGHVHDVRDPVWLAVVHDDVSDFELRGDDHGWLLDSRNNWRAERPLEGPPRLQMRSEIVPDPLPEAQALGSQ